MLQHVLQAFRRLPGHRLLATMPKNVDLTERRDARSAKTKKLKSYLFNCGEGTQRLSHERKTRLARLENVFVTCNSWRNVGGVLGALLTLNDIGVPALTLHGPPGLSSLYDDTRSFIQLRGMNVQHRSDTDSDFVDVGLKVRAVPLYGEGVLPVTPEVYRAELAADETFVARLDEYRRARSTLPPSDDVYPQTVFLGTGSSIPNKKRNTSGILVNLSEKHSILLDCGEGTHGQLVRLQGSEGAAETLRRLSAIYISHLHADHHIGLISILEARRRALGADHKPCLLMAPAPITNYLNMYHSKMAPLRDTFTLVHNAALLTSRSPPPDWITRRLTEAGLAQMTTCLVRHCPLAYGMRLAHTEGQEVVYSGDTRPCDELVELGRGCDLLIHEATHEDELQEEAVLRAHSTVSEAIEVGVRMGARHVLLTHFSQRYASLPMLPEPAPNNVGIAYDNMVINHGHLPRVPLLYPALRRAFAESYDQCVERTAKRRDRKLREAEVLAEAERTA
ncbi:Ribonuclease Z, mitochondrial [Amphibalanus amphitrite]|uniref:Zinc phosphodiesterase ELAC protein 2 n=1 Tax=Amphibalanus amphitrite TaxID=1232801 RepID=A0A6A4W9E3_AMPAM|nr:Ribonuclease Z, mitochondrial [Amphibalanus amphitrite]